MRRIIHGAVWKDLIANGAPHRGRYYCQDPDFPGGYLIYDLAKERMPKNLDDDGENLPSKRSEANRQSYVRRVQRGPTHIGPRVKVPL